MIYLDNAATTQESWTAVKASSEFGFTAYGNPSSAHEFGRKAREAVEKSREKVAHSIGADKNEIYFTSGGSESDNTAIKGVAFAHIGTPKRHIITSAIEHPAVLNSCKWLEKFGFKTTYVKPDKHGLISVSDVLEAITPETLLISIMMANNEIGTLEPIEEIANAIKGKNIYLHTDAVQAVGSVYIDVKSLGVDMLSMSAHKFRGPKGIGALYIKKGTLIDPLIHGGGQEHGLRSGTENTKAIVGMGAAIAEATEKMYEHNAKTSLARKIFREELDKLGVKYHVNGDERNRLSNNLNLSFPDYSVRNLVARLDFAGLACSSGSACSSNNEAGSHVLKAIGCTKDEMDTSVRFTFGDDFDDRKIIEAARKVAKALEEVF